MKTLTHTQFIALVSAHAGAAIVGIEALTDAKARKTNNPHGPIMKHVRAVGFVGANYEAAVQREGERQGADASSFVASSLPWGAWHVPNKVISHKGEYYLRTQTTPGQRQRQAAKVLAYRDAKGMFLSPDDAKPFLPAPSYSVKQGNVGVGDEGAHNQVMVRTYKLSSIRKVRVNGETFELLPDNGERPAVLQPAPKRAPKPARVGISLAQWHAIGEQVKAEEASAYAGTGSTGGRYC